MSISIPHIQQSDVERWTKVLETVSQKVSTSIETGSIQNGRQIALHFRNSTTAASVAYACGNISKMLKHFREALERHQMLFLPAYAGQIDNQYIYETSEEVLCIALILRDESVLNLADKLLPYTQGQKDARVQFISAITAILRGGKKEAVDISKTLANASTMAYGKALPNAICAIANKDLNGFYSEIASATDSFDRLASGEARGTPEAAIFIRGAALVGLYEIVNREKVDVNKLDIRLLPGIDAVG